MYINEKECNEVGLNIKKIESISRRISKAAKEAQEMGVIIFGGSGSGDLRFDDNHNNAKNKMLIIAVLDGIFDGGDGSCCRDGNDLMRGE